MESRSSEKRLKALQNIVAENPWFSIGQQLLAIETKKLDKDEFEEHLGKAAVYSIYRDFLYYRLCDPSQNYDDTELKNIDDEKIIETEQEKQELTTSEQTETEQITEEKENNEKPIIDEQEKEEQETEKPKIEEEKPEEEQKTEEQPKEEQAKEEQEKAKEKPKTEEQPFFETPVPDYFTNSTEKLNETTDDIIDKFLASSQKISAVGKKEETAETAITEPIYDDDFVTETLAKIYTEQGYISKAIAVYEKLSLQNSKKSTYFATLIENLKRKN